MKQDHKLHLGQRGFSLIELMIVIAIIGILVGIGVPAYRAIVRSGNETSAIKTLQTIAVDQKLYYKQHQGNSYGTFDQLVADVDLDKRFVGDAPIVGGYVFTMKITPKASGQPAAYTVNADPQTDTSGTNHFYLDASSDTVKVNAQQPAGPEDPPISQ